jgi:hypothetical protein
MVGPFELAEVVRRRLNESAHELNAYWFTVTAANRQEYASLLRDALREDPVAVFVVRDRFDNPNSVLNDLVNLMEQHRHVFLEEAVAKSGWESRCAVVLLSRSELSIPQASSPVALPGWVPVKGGTTLTVLIEDLTWVADAGVSSSATRVDELSELLFRLEGALLQRLKTVLARDHRKSNALLEALRQEDTHETFADILKAAADHRSTVTSAASFRPSVREARSLTARLWSLAQRHSADAGQPAKALASALDLPSDAPADWYESFSSVLRRPTSREADWSRRFARNVLTTIAVSCQLITAAAHSDEYPNYPIVLLRSVSFDLRQSLDSAEALLVSLEF